MKKIIWIFVSFIGIACASPYIGIKVPYEDLHSLHSLKNTNHHELTLEHILLNYDFIIDEDLKTISFNGFIRVRKDITETSGAWDIHKCRIEILFVDDNRTVINVGYFTVFPKSNIYEPVKFHKTLPYDSKYDSVAFNYRVETRL